MKSRIVRLPLIVATCSIIFGFASLLHAKVPRVTTKFKVDP